MVLKNKMYVVSIIFFELIYLSISIILYLRYQEYLLLKPAPVFFVLFGGIVFMIISAYLLSPNIVLPLPFNQFLRKTPFEAGFNINNLICKKNKIKQPGSYLFCRPTFIAFLKFNSNGRQPNYEMVKFSQDVYLKFSAKGLHFQPINERKMYIIPRETIKKIEFSPWLENSSEKIKLLWVRSDVLVGSIVFATGISVNGNKLTVEQMLDKAIATYNLRK